MFSNAFQLAASVGNHVPACSASLLFLNQSARAPGVPPAAAPVFGWSKGCSAYRCLRRRRPGRDRRIIGGSAAAGQLLHPPGLPCVGSGWYPARERRRGRVTRGESAPASRRATPHSPVSSPTGPPPHRRRPQRCQTWVRSSTLRHSRHRPPALAFHTRTAGPLPQSSLGLMPGLG